MSAPSALGIDEVLRVHGDRARDVLLLEVGRHAHVQEDEVPFAPVLGEPRRRDEHLGTRRGEADGDRARGRGWRGPSSWGLRDAIPRRSQRRLLVEMAPPSAAVPSSAPAMSHRRPLDSRPGRRLPEPRLVRGVPEGDPREAVGAARAARAGARGLPRARAAGPPRGSARGARGVRGGGRATTSSSSRTRRRASTRSCGRSRSRPATRSSRRTTRTPRAGRRSTTPRRGRARAWSWRAVPFPLRGEEEVVSAVLSRP